MGPVRRIEWATALQIAATYVGTVVGAGFASGQEVLQFFTRYGTGALPAIALATLLFFGAGYYVLTLGRNRGVQTYREVSAMLFGRRANLAANAALYAMIFGVVAAMVAGSGALFAQQFGWPFSAGALFCIALTGVTLARGIKGILYANSFIVPAMVLFIVGTFAYRFATGGIPEGHPLSVAKLAGMAGLSAIAYVGFNLSFSLTVLIPLGTVPKNRATLAAGAAAGSLVLGAMLYSMHALLSPPGGPGGVLELPMGRVAESLPSWLRIGFVLILFAEIYSTLAANVYGLACEFSAGAEPRGTRNALFVGAVLAAAFLVCQVGFGRIVGYAYPVFGYVSVVVLAALILSERRFLRL